MCRILNVSILEGIKIRRGKNISLKFVLEQMRLMSVLFGWFCCFYLETT